MKKRLHVRTFSVQEAALAFVMMRNLSIQLFEVLETRGVILPHGWKDFKEEWLAWDRSVGRR